MKACSLSLLLFLWPISQIVARAETVYLPDLVRVRFDVPVAWARVSKIVDGDTVWVDFDGDGSGGVQSQGSTQISWTVLSKNRLSDMRRMFSGGKPDVPKFQMKMP